MEKYLVELKDLSKRAFLLELLAQLDFVEVRVEKEDKDNSKEEEGSYDFFASAGLFSGRDINANQLRKEAWRIPN